MNTPRTPREILLGRHAGSARPALDTQRDALLARFTASGSAAAPAPPAPSRPASALSFLSFFATLHRELFAPYRLAWTSLACAWIGILALQQIDRLAAPLAAPGQATAEDSASSAPLLALWLEQRRQLAALVAGSAALDSPASSASAREQVSPPTSSRPLGIVSPPPARLALA